MAVPAGGGRGGFHRFLVTSMNNDESWGEPVFSPLDSSVCAVFYAAIIAIFLMVIALIVKLLRNIVGDDIHQRRGAAATERTELLPPKEEIPYNWYGTSDKDLESGKGTSSSSLSSSSSDELYDGKICVICYDDQRSCFFIPCGHCVTCHTCANRIVSEENKSCPICRTFINHVTKLHLL